MPPPPYTFKLLFRHGDGFYPGGEKGGCNKIGEGEGLGKNVNIPFTEPYDNEDFTVAFHFIVLSIIKVSLSNAISNNPFFLDISKVFV